MKPTRRMFLTFLILSLSLGICHAQKERNIWCFGIGAELNFNSGSPVSDSGCVLNTEEGCASIADKSTGQLLFYTDGVVVYNRNNDTMPGWIKPLGGNFSTTQSAFILPMPGNTREYYLFCTDAQAGAGNHDIFYQGGDSGTQYCIIDMNLDNGLGGIAQQPKHLLSPTCEKIAATSMANSNGYWVVVHLWNSDAFYAYPVTNAGIDSPVISHVGVVNSDDSVNQGTGLGAIGYMRLSPDGKKIAVAIQAYPLVQTYNFNDTTGSVSPPIFSDSNFYVYDSSYGYFPTQPYGLCFSPNSQFLYASDLGQGVYQYNLEAGNDTQILASKTMVSTNTEASAIQLGADGKMYVTISFEDAKHLDGINYPDSMGPLCGYTNKAVYLNYGTAVFGLPEFPPELNSDCQSASISIIVAGDTLSTYGFVGYQWYADSNAIPYANGPVYIASQPGSYSVAVTDSNGCTTLSTPVTITGITNLAEEPQVLLYPNPCATASVQLAVSSELIGNRLAVYDIQGQLVFTSAIRNPQSEIPVSGLAAGVYFVQVSSPNGGVVRKLVKM